MKFMGSKSRLQRELVEVTKPYRGDRPWVEPFVGGGNMIEAVDGIRIGADVNPYAVEALKLIRDNPESIPDLVTEDDYQRAKDAAKNGEVSGLIGYIGFALSFGGKFFGGYRRDKAGTKGDMTNMQNQSRRSKNSALAQSPKLKGVDLQCTSYDKLVLPENSFIYCDPPYEGTTKYRDKFDHKAFWQWCREKANEGHVVFVSEYNAPPDFECVWQRQLSTTLSTSAGKKDTEKLFRYVGKENGRTEEAA